MVRARIGYFRLGRQREPSERSGLQVERSRHPRREEAPGGPGPGRGHRSDLWRMRSVKEYKGAETMKKKCPRK